MTSNAVYIIAEAGVNHNGSIELARQLIDGAANAGADVVKFQTFRSEQLVSRSAPKAEYQTRTTEAGESQLEMLQKLELSVADHHALMAHCGKRGIAFLSTPFDHPSVDLLARDFKLPLLKIPSGEVTNAPLLLHAARTGCKIILSTGMSSLGDVETALGVLAFGYTQPDVAPSLPAFAEAFASPAGQAALQSKVSLLHCTTEYPAPFEDTNLRAMDTLKAAFGLPVGLSDHTPGIAIAIAAAARGATIIEKHFTTDRNLPGPDHKASLEVDELAHMVASIRQVEAALGSPLKVPALVERKNKIMAGKSLVAARAITRGETFSDENLMTKRPGGGVSPLRFWEWIGKTAARDYEADELIEM